MTDTTLILLHSVAQDHRAWHDVVGALPSNLRVVTPDVEEFGLPIVLDDVADQIMAGVEGPVDVVGTAFGGIVAQHIIVRHTPRVRSAVLVNTPPAMNPTPTYSEFADQALKVGLAPLLEPALNRWFTPSAVANDAPGVRYVRQRFDEMSPELYSSYMHAMGTHNLREQLKGLSLPTTLVIARGDAVAPRPIGELHELLTNSRVREIEGSHMVHLEYPKEYAELVADHLTWVEAGAGAS